MPPKKRTIKFYTIEEKEWVTEEITPALRLKDVIEHIRKLNRIDRRHKLTRTKMCFMDSISPVNNNAQSIIIKSAKTEYRPRLINRETIEERDNPKQRIEGDAEKTHLVVKYVEDDVYVILERNGNGVNINAIISYLKKFTKLFLVDQDEKMNFSLVPAAVAKNNFLQEVRRLERITLGEVYVEKSILGSSALGFSNRTQAVRHEVVINLKANKQESLRSTVEDIFNQIGSEGSVINKMRVRGKDRQTGGEIMLDTSFIEKVESIEADINELTGEVTSPNILTRLREIAEGL